MVARPKILGPGRKFFQSLWTELGGLHTQLLPFSDLLSFFFQNARVGGLHAQLLPFSDLLQFFFQNARVFCQRKLCLFRAVSLGRLVRCCLCYRKLSGCPDWHANWTTKDHLSKSITCGQCFFSRNIYSCGRIWLLILWKESIDKFIRKTCLWEDPCLISSASLL